MNRRGVAVLGVLGAVWLSLLAWRFAVQVYTGTTRQCRYVKIEPGPTRDACVSELSVWMDTASAVNACGGIK